MEYSSDALPRTSPPAVPNENAARQMVMAPNLMPIFSIGVSIQVDLDFTRIAFVDHDGDVGKDPVAHTLIVMPTAAAMVLADILKSCHVQSLAKSEAQKAAAAAAAAAAYGEVE